MIPVILSGGAGTRLWPVSREGHPKPFMKLPDGQSLLQKAFARAAELAPEGEIVTVTNHEYYFISKDEFEAARTGGKLSVHFLLEPQGRNTAAAIALAALHVKESAGPESVMLVMAADHLIQDDAAFAAAARQAERLAQSGLLVTFGVPPTRPETGYGYIQCGPAVGSGGGAKVQRFVEKPSRQKAEEYLRAGNYLWNSGMFCFTAAAILRQLELHAPGVIEQALLCWDASRKRPGNTAGALELDGETFARLPNLSIDVAVMEKSSDVAVVPARFGWSDIGSWDAVSALVDPDQHGNRIIGHAVTVDAHGNFIHGEGRLVAVLGVDNLFVVDTPDALLVAAKDRAQDVKAVAERLKQAGHESYRLHRTVMRPWGTYTVLEESKRFKIKRIVVKPGASLSLQMHHHRSEHWVVVSGMAKVINGDRELFINTDESTYIPAGHLHRIENPGVLDLVLIEVQSGEYLGEDDIVRFEDRYGRT